MYEKGKRKGTIRFSVKPDGTHQSVSVAGSFNGWQPVALRKQKDGSYVANLPIDQGMYEYKFIVDDQWQLDPDNSAWSADPRGNVNSLMTNGQ